MFTESWSRDQLMQKTYYGPLVIWLEGLCHAICYVIHKEICYVIHKENSKEINV